MPKNQAGPSPTKRNVIIGVAVAVAVVLVTVIILAVGSDEVAAPAETPAPSESTPPADQTPADPPVPAEPPTGTGPAETSPATSPPEPAETPPPTEPNEINPRQTDPPNNQLTEPLPENWDQLSLPEKAALNPYDCPAGDDNIVHIDTETGKCLDQPQRQDEQPPDPGLTETDLQQALVGTFFKSWQLEVTATNFACGSLTDLALEQANGKSPAEIQAAFERYKQGLYHSSISSQERWELLKMFGALEYMNNLGAWLKRPEASPAELWRALGDYRQCALSLKVKNVGSDRSFSDGCLFDGDFDRYTELTDNQARTHQPKYLGQGWACTQAEVPFPAGDSVDARVIFTLPTGAGPATITISDDQQNEISIPGIET